MKQTVIIFTGKDNRIPRGKTIPRGSYDENALMEVVNKWFNSDKFDVQIIDYPECRCFYNIDQIWKEVRLPILIGYGEGANYIAPIKNFIRKYLISPKIYPNTFYYSDKIDEYDEENTICLFGGDEKSVKNAHQYEQHYPYTHSELAEGELDLCNGIESVIIFEALLNKTEL